jgi:hypothetical protein
VNYPIAGTYIATLVIANGHQTDTTRITIGVIPGACVSVPEYVSTFNVSIAPNPVSSTAKIEIRGLDLTGNITMQLYNYLGQKIGVPLSIKENVFILNVESIPPGGYFFNIIKDRSVIKTEKLVISNH